MLIEDHEFKNGDMAMNILNIDLDFVESMFSDLTKGSSKNYANVYLKRT